VPSTPDGWKKSWNSIPGIRWVNDTSIFSKSSPFPYYEMTHELTFPPLRVKALGKDIRTEWPIVFVSDEHDSVFNRVLRALRGEMFFALRRKFRDARMTSQKLYVTFSADR
jgi:hypothetical protein